MREFLYQQITCTLLDIEQILIDRYPQRFNEPPRLLKRPLIATFRLLFHEREINQFLEQILEHFCFSDISLDRDKQDIPASGRVVIVANHPLGARELGRRFAQPRYWGSRTLDYQ